MGKRKLDDNRDASTAIEDPNQKLQKINDVFKNDEQLLKKENTAAATNTTVPKKQNVEK